MNDYIPRQRHRNLLIVEGEHEENKLFDVIFRVFPELEITIEDVMIYRTNIYMLYKDIVNEYGDYWYDEDVDLPFIVGKKKNYPITLNKKDFINIYLVFDYEHHDPNFCEQHIEQIQRYFCDSTEMGKLYLNYPMIESYKHFSKIPDENYESLTVKVTLKSGSQYKIIVHNSYVDRLVSLPQKIEGLLNKLYGVTDVEKCRLYTDRLLEISNKISLHKSIGEVFSNELSKTNLQKAENHFEKLLSNKEHILNNCSYYKFMRNILRAIIMHNIIKASKILKTYYETSDYKNLYELLDLYEILKEQNTVGKDKLLGYIWVLNTCIFIIPDYNFKLIDSSY